MGRTETYFSRNTKQSEAEIWILHATYLGKHLLQFLTEYNSRVFLRRHLKKLKLPPSPPPPAFSMYAKALLRKQTFPCALIGWKTCGFFLHFHFNLCFVLPKAALTLWSGHMLGPVFILHSQARAVKQGLGNRQQILCVLRIMIFV